MSSYKYFFPHWNLGIRSYNASLCLLFPLCVDTFARFITLLCLLYSFQPLFNIYMYLFIYFLWLCAQRGLWPPRYTRFLDHTQRRATVSRTDSSGRLISSSQRPLPDNTQQTNIHAPGGIRNHNRSRRAAVDLHLKPHGDSSLLRNSYP
jgi:hypothetical protein